MSFPTQNLKKNLEMARFVANFSPHHCQFSHQYILSVTRTMIFTVLVEAGHDQDGHLL